MFAEAVAMCRPTLPAQRAAFKAIKEKAPTIRQRCLTILTINGPMTADEVAKVMGKSILSVRPRMTELANAFTIVAVPGQTKMNASGKKATVWRRRT